MEELNESQPQLGSKKGEIKVTIKVTIRAEKEAMQPKGEEPLPFSYEPSSHYVIASFYDWLTEVSKDLSLAEIRSEALVDEEIRRQVEQLLAVEARLLDQGAYERWLDLYVEQCAYWIPSEPDAHDLRETVAIEFHDRRRLLDRVSRLGTGLAYSQLPPSRTARQMSGLEIWSSSDREDEWRVRYSFTLAETRVGHSRVLAGWNGFVLRKADDGVKIVVKQINLIDCDAPQGNNSFFL